MNVLISGAGIGGPALARFLLLRGHTCTIVERASSTRGSGQAIDVRGAALQVAERLGILAEMRAARTQMRGMSFVDHDGNEIMRSEEQTMTSGRFDSDDIELLREELVDLLYERTRHDVEYLFGDSIGVLDLDEHEVKVRFVGGDSRTFDLVVGADGLHSNVRRLAFGPPERFIHHFGRYLAIFSMENVLGLQDWQIWSQERLGPAGGVPRQGQHGTQSDFWLPI
jgi:2-polyprenyl-6-methoxyphenol hydroxylase-like FAD-dependent oxidoreductase